MLVASVAEQPRKLALMRGEDDLRIVRGLDRFEQPLRRLGKTRQRVGIQYKVTLRRQCGVDEIASARAHTGAWSDHAGIEPDVIKYLRELDHRVDGANHHRRQRRGVDDER